MAGILAVLPQRRLSGAEIQVAFVAPATRGGAARIVLDLNVSHSLRLVMAYTKIPLDALAVLGDPTRRRLFERLAEGPAPVGELARAVPVTRAAVSQHLRVLKDAGLVSDVAQGTRRIYRIDPRGIGAIRAWLDRHWSESLANFRDLADADPGGAAEREDPT